MQAAEEVNAISLATADAQGRPSVRVVLLKGFDTRGFVWYTNYNSRKGQELQANPMGAFSVYWEPMQRQVGTSAAIVGLIRAKCVRMIGLMGCRRSWQRWR